MANFIGLSPSRRPPGGVHGTRVSDRGARTAPGTRECPPERSVPFLECFKYFTHAVVASPPYDEIADAGAPGPCCSDGRFIPGQAPYSSTTTRFRRAYDRLIPSCLSSASFFSLVCFSLFYVSAREQVPRVLLQGNLRCPRRFIYREAGFSSV